MRHQDYMLFQRLIEAERKARLAQLSATSKKKTGPPAKVKRKPQPDLVAGSVYGIRAFRTGVTNSSLLPLSGAGVGSWSTGWNTAQCPSLCAIQRYRDLYGSNEFSMLMGLSPWRSQTVPAQVTPDCSCGFHAFTDAARMDAEVSVSDTELLTGIVEGAGRTVVARYGVRCQRARVVALVAPSQRPKWIDLIVLFFTLIGLVSSLSGLLDGFDVIDWLNVGLAVLNAALLASAARRATAGWRRRRPVVRTAEAFGVPVFKSRAAAVEAFPLGMVEPGRKAG